MQFGVCEAGAGLVDLVVCVGCHGGAGHLFTCARERFIGRVAEDLAQVSDRGVELAKGRSGGTYRQAGDGGRRFVGSEPVEKGAEAARWDVARLWHACGMTRIRLSTTVDAELLSSARGVRAGITDAALIEEALSALLARHRSAEVDASYGAYDKHPVDEPDEWGDLASWRRAAGNS